MQTHQCSPTDFSRPLTYCQLYSFLNSCLKRCICVNGVTGVLQLLHGPPGWELLPSTLHTPHDLFYSLVSQEPDSDNDGSDEWQHLLATTEPVPIQLKAPLTLLCNPDFCQRIQSQLQEAGAQVTDRRILWRGFETIFTDEALENIDIRRKRKFVPFQLFFSSSA